MSHRSPLRACSALCVLAAACAAPPSASAASARSLARAAESITADDAWQHVAALASDTFEGREGGSRGGRAAGAYLLDHLRRRGYQPGGPHGDFEQPFGNGYRNILVLLPGRDPELRHEHIVIGAHYDHVGFGRSNNSNGPVGYIHNGADDNASGTAGLLELLDAFAALPERPARSLLFVFWDGEEQGLLGSEHWVRNPTVPLEHVRLLINADMIGRMTDETLEVYGARTAAGLRQLVSEQNAATGLRLKFDWTIRADSDHYPFFRNRIPFLMLHTGLHPDYHRPSDDVDRLNLPDLERVTRLLFALAHAAADADRLPQFRDEVHREGSDLARRLESPLRTPPKGPLRLGISWRRDPGEPTSVILSRVVPRSAAAAAGLTVGDRIYALDGQRFPSPDEFRDSMRASAGERLLTVERDGRLREVQVSIPAATAQAGDALAPRSK